MCIRDSQISEKGDGTEDVLRSLDGSKQAISITSGSFAGGLSGKLRNGDIVSVLVTGEDYQTIIPPELKYVRVITATSSKGMDAGQVNEDGQEELPSTVTLLVNEVQARLLANRDVYKRQVLEHAGISVGCMLDFEVRNGCLIARPVVGITVPDVDERGKLTRKGK